MNESVEVPGTRGANKREGPKGTTQKKLDVPGGDQCPRSSNVRRRHCYRGTYSGSNGHIEDAQVKEAAVSKDAEPTRKEAAVSPSASESDVDAGGQRAGCGDGPGAGEMGRRGSGGQRRSKSFRDKRTVRVRDSEFSLMPVPRGLQGT